VTTKGPINEGLQIPRAAAGNLGDSLRNLQRYLHDQNYDNQQGGQADTGADIQFDSMGVDFGPWLRRFKNQIERNWLVPQAAMSLKGRVVIQFWVLRNGSIVDMKVVQPSEIAAFTTSALNALKLSNPTTPLPPEYPADKVLFTVTFHYNEFVRDDR
jgi:TonB family protein